VLYARCLVCGYVKKAHNYGTTEVHDAGTGDVFGMHASKNSHDAVLDNLCTP
jgi:hypothetical protein